MLTSWLCSPIFRYECLVSARRWQVYAGRVLLVGGLLGGLALVWMARSGSGTASSFQELAQVGAAFTTAILAVELVLTLLLVPAATAGAFCAQKAGGELALMMTTELTDTEIVLSKLASNLVLVLGVLFCGLPVLAITSALGGVDPVAIFCGTLVITAVAVLAVSVSLTFSIWATRPYESLMATYATWAAWLLPLLCWTELSSATTPSLLYATNPIWVTLGYRRFNGNTTPSLLLAIAFLSGSLLLSAGLMLVSIYRIRAITVGQSSRPSTARRGSREEQRTWLGRIGLAGPSLDANPVLWHEWHRRESSPWTRAIWILSALAATVFALLAIFVNDNIGGGVAGFTVALGLILVTVKATSTLAEERSTGSLSILLSTPLSTRSVLLGKWWGAFRMVPLLTVLPAILTLALGLQRGRWIEAIPMTLVASGLILAYGAAVTSLGLHMATRQPRLGRAIALSVGAYLLALLVLPTVVIVYTPPHPLELGVLGFSPFFGAYVPICGFLWNGRTGALFFQCLVWTLLSGSFALLLFRRTLRTFDRRLGRMPDSESQRRESVQGWWWAALRLSHPTNRNP